MNDFCASKDIINKVWRQLTEWEKMVTSKKYGKILISRTYTELLTTQHQKLNNAIQKQAKDLIEILQREYTNCQQAYGKMPNITNH